jgi:hypothetical protein
VRVEQLPFASWRQAEWLQPLVSKLLDNDAQTSALLGRNPFLDGSPPRWVRAVLWEYEYAPPGGSAHWSRKYVREWMPPQSHERRLR